MFCSCVWLGPSGAARWVCSGTSRPTRRRPPGTRTFHRLGRGTVTCGPRQRVGQLCGRLPSPPFWKAGRDSAAHVLSSCWLPPAVAADGGDGGQPAFVAASVAVDEWHRRQRPPAEGASRAGVRHLCSRWTVLGCRSSNAVPDADGAFHCGHGAHHPAWGELTTWMHRRTPMHMNSIYLIYLSRPGILAAVNNASSAPCDAPSPRPRVSACKR